MAHGAHALTHDDAHGGIENRLTALLAALTTGLAALVLNAFGNGIGGMGGFRGRRYGAHGGSFLYALVVARRVMGWTGNQKAPFRSPARHPQKSPRMRESQTAKSRPRANASQLSVDAANG